MDPTARYKSYVGYWVKRAFLVSSNKVNDALRPYGLAGSQWQVLFYIYHSKAISQKELQSAMHIESATLTGIVDALVRKKWVTRIQGDTDRRSNILALAEEGKKRWEEIPDPIEVVSKQMMKGVTKEEKALIIGVLRRMVNNLES